MSFLFVTVRRAVNVLLLLLFVAATVSFSVGSYRWAFKVNRMKPQAINPVMYPSFTLVNTSRLCCSQEPYYRLWRTYDWRADGYADERMGGNFHRVPVVYVHGNGGSYFCARSLARFLYEANVRQRRLSLSRFDEKVRRQVYQLMQEAEPPMQLEKGGKVPIAVVDKAEETVLREHTPMLATEMFSLDYLEESYTQSAAMTMKEARFMNHSMHVLMHNFLDSFETVLATPATESLRAAATHGDDQAHEDDITFRTVVDEYESSCCRSSGVLGVDHGVCRVAREHLSKYSTVARVRLEVERVKTRGFWVWSESLGGTVAILAALMSPSLFAGIVLVGSPTHYPPLFFDVGSAWLYKVISDASIRYYPQTQRMHTISIDWENRVLPHDTPLGLLDNLKALPSEAIAARFSNTTLMSINGGALDDIIPSITGYLYRSTPRQPGFYTQENLEKLRKADTTYGAFRRVVSTETMRGVGMPMDHRGLVYGLQFLNHSADSLVLAALLPDADKFFAVEAALPSTMRERLFPAIVETLPPRRYNTQVEEELFIRALDDATEDVAAPQRQHESDDAVEPSAKVEVVEQEAGAHTYARVYDRSEVVKARGMHEVCVSSSDPEPLDLSLLPTEEEDAMVLFDTHGRRLTLILGSTTYMPEEVLFPRLDLYRDKAHTQPILVDGADGIVRVRPATKLHLPFMRKDRRHGIYGRILNTVISFQITRVAPYGDKNGAPAEPQHAYPRFCFHVQKAPTKPKSGAGDAQQQQQQQQRSFLQYDVIDPSGIESGAVPVYLGPHYIGNRLALEAHKGYTFVTGLDSATQETRMQVDADKAAGVFPLVIAGSLRSFYITARGNSNIPADDPEDQTQYFFGPFDQGTTQFNYSWKVFSTFGDDLNDTYLVYTIGDHSNGRPRVTMHDVTAAIEARDAGLFSPASLRWWMDQWPERWLAFFSAFSGIGKLGGAYVLLFFSFYVLAGEPVKWFLYDSAMRTRWVSQSCRRVFYAVPLLVAVAVTVAVELGCGTWASTALKVCRESDPPSGLTDAEMTARMGWFEKFTLVVLYAMVPEYRSCQYSWIYIQSVPVWTSFAEHVCTILFGFVFSAFLLVILMTIGGAFFTGGRILNVVFRTKAVLRNPTTAKVFLFLWWCIPTAGWIAVPNIPLSYRHALTTGMVMALSGWLPNTTPPGYCFPIYYIMCAVACIFPSHFDGAALTIRNHVMLHRVPEAFWDRERNTNISFHQGLVWAIVQAGVGVLYITLYLVIQDEQSRRDAITDGNGTKKTKCASDGATVTGKREKAAATTAYTLGNIGVKYPAFRSIIRVLSKLLAFLSAWVCIIVLRRPLEGGVILVGNMTLLLYMLSILVALW